ncbi:sigma-70 family RNA polymerase sigma factor [Turicibacter sanguinis]|uniref:RNA polymerase sigma factor n=1 Tax=Turicibacter sanguinis TaxID=154288 RepID=UPI002943F6A1|nr:sigma-70 family RNA polymerase sigma factor [Turicibacter sanguinis]
MKKDTYQSAQMVVERLIEDYGQDVLKIAYLYVKDQQLAEDIFQEVFYKVMKNYHKFEHLSSEKTWLIRITINTCKDLLRTSWLRRVTTFGTLEEQNQTQYEQPFDTTQSESNNELYEMIMKLPQRYKEVILLFYYEDFSYDEMAKILNIPKGTVQSRLARGREKLKKMMEERGEISGR